MNASNEVTNPISVFGRPLKPFTLPHNHHLLAALGVRRLPDAGLPPTVINGVKVWANALTGEAPTRGKRHTHRLVAQCPVCSEVMSAGRLAQHATIHATKDA